MAGEYKDFAKIMQERLDDVSPSFCLAKWLQVSLHLPQGRTHSCYHPPSHKIPLKNLDDNPSLLHNTPKKIEERRLMKEGQRPEGCSYCWRIEDNSNEHSDRHYRSSEWWATEAFDEVKNNNFDYNVIPRYVEVNFNQSCNFKCMYCSPHLSTSWEEEIKQHGGYVLDGMVHNDLSALTDKGLMPLKVANDNNPYVKAFWKWWPTIYRKLRIFRMTGGEPLMDKNTFKILDYVNENPHGQLELSITSNMCPPDQKLFDKFLYKVQKLEEIRTYEDKENFNIYSNNYWYVDKGFKHFWLYISLDAVGEQAEYIRTGLEYDRLLKNTKEFLNETKYTTVSFINTFNILSIPSFKNFLQLILDLRKEFGAKNQKEFLIDPQSNQNEQDHGIVHKKYKQEKFQRIFFDIPLLTYPNWFVAQNADSELIKILEDCLDFMIQSEQESDYHLTFEGVKPHEISKLKRNIDIIKQGIPENEKKLNKLQFKNFIQQYDYRRSLSFNDTFPEMSNFLKDI